jgi:hypothetical protein
LCSVETEYASRGECEEDEEAGSQDGVRHYFPPFPPLSTFSDPNYAKQQAPVRQ